MPKPLTAERLRELVTYDPVTGYFTSKVVRSGRKPKNPYLGTLDRDGYLSFGVNGDVYFAHRLAWLYMTGEWPEPECDHENRVGSDNRWVNLREATHAQNSQNRRRRTDNSSGVTGVHFHKDTGKWGATIMVDGRARWLGLHDTVETAAEVYAAAKAQLHQFQPTVP